MKNLVVYSSTAGNTEKLAQALAENLPGEVHIHTVAQAPDPGGYDLVALGFWFKAGGPDPASAEYLPKLNGQKTFLFATHGAKAGSDHVRAGMAKAGELAKGAQIVGQFSCQGEVKPEILAKLEQKDPRPPWLDGAKEAVGHPNQDDIQGLLNALKDSNLL